MNRNSDGRLLINGKRVEWPGNKARLLIGLSVLNIFDWLLTTTFTAMVLVKFNKVDSFMRYHSLDLLCPGVWGSLFFGLSGLLGMCAAYEQRQPLLVGTLVFALLSIFSSMGISAVSGAMAFMTQFRARASPTWLGLEWTLLVLGAVGFLVNLCVFVIVSTQLCRPCCPQQRTTSPSTVSINGWRRKTRNEVLRRDLLDALFPTPPPPGWINQDADHDRDRARQQTDNQKSTAVSPLPRALVSDSGV